MGSHGVKTGGAIRLAKKDKAVRRAIMQNIGHLTQLGFSIAFPPILCTYGAMWLRDRFELGSWIVLAGVLFGVTAGLWSFLNFATHMIHRANRKDDERS